MRTFESAARKVRRLAGAASKVQDFGDAKKWSLRHFSDELHQQDEPEPMPLPRARSELDDPECTRQLHVDVPERVPQFAQR